MTSHGDLAATTGAPMPVTERIEQLVAERGEQPAMTSIGVDGAETVASWSDLGRGLAAASVALHRHGVGPDDIVALALPKSFEHFYLTFACWRLGARVLPLNERMPAQERGRILELAAPKVVVGTEPWPATLGPLHAVRVDDGVLEAYAALPPAPARAAIAVATGGSTGLPKIVLSPFPGAFIPALQPPDLPVTGRERDMVQLVTGPLFHNAPYTVALGGLMWGHHLVLMPKFDPQRALTAVRRHRVSFLPTVPTVLKRLLDVDGVDDADLSSLRAVFHTGAPCPPSVKEGWIRLVGAERVYEAFGGSELIGASAIRGDDWLEHRGSVGKPIGAELMILRPDGSEAPTGEIGEIYMRPLGDGPGYAYLGGSANPQRHGMESLGDLGRVDADGYLYIADRRTDLILTGGSNVYPAEVENALFEHSAVRDVAVVGLPDADWGQSVHAIVSLSQEGVDAADLLAHCRAELSAYKVPKSIEFVDELPRDEAGKIRRSALAEARAGSL